MSYLKLLSKKQKQALHAWFRVSFWIWYCVNQEEHQNVIPLEQKYCLIGLREIAGVGGECIENGAW